MFRRLISLGLALFSPAGLAQPTPLKVKVFPGAQNLPLFAAQSQRIFERYGLAVEILFTQNSQEQRDGLARGEFHIAHAAVDNAISMVERGKHDVVIVAGGDSSMNELFVKPEVRSFTELKGRTVIVDAPNTAYALQLKKILLMNGLREGTDYAVKPIGGTHLRLTAVRENKEYAASMLNPPFSIEARDAGLKSLGRATELIGPYQGGGAFVMRDWAKANADALERYLAAYIEGVRWAVAPQNGAAGARMLADRLKLSPTVAERTVELMCDPAFGVAPDARFDMQGFRNVLALRAEIEGDWGGKPPSPERYIDLSYYERARKRLRR